MEDLWAFNHETVARAIRGISIPVISAVGHGLTSPSPILLPTLERLRRRLRLNSQCRHVSRRRATS